VAIIDKQYLPLKTLQIVVDYSSTSCNMGVITIQQPKKNIKPQRKTFKIREIFMFYHLKSWKSWQVVSFSFISMSRNSKKKFN
jgi:hypothetical protein